MAAPVIKPCSCVLLLEYETLCVPKNKLTALINETEWGSYLANLWFYASNNTSEMKVYVDRTSWEKKL